MLKSLGKNLYVNILAVYLEAIQMSFSGIIKLVHFYYWTQNIIFGKESTCNTGDIRDPSSIPGLGRSPGEGNGNPLQYSCMENFMDRGAWWATVHVVPRVGHNWATKIPPPCNTEYKVKRNYCEYRKQPITSRKFYWQIMANLNVLKRLHTVWLYLSVCMCVLNHSVMSNSLQLHGM